MIALSSFAGRSGRLVGFVELGLEADRVVIDLGGNRQVGYPNGVLVHVTNTARIHVSKALVPNEAKGLASQVADLPSDVFIWVVEAGRVRPISGSRSLAAPWTESTGSGAGLV